MTDAAIIIDALGGTSATARLTDTPVSTVHSWRKKGIPRSRLAHLKLVAEREGVDVDWQGATGHGDRVVTETTTSSSGIVTNLSGEVVS